MSEHHEHSGKKPEKRKKQRPEKVRTARLRVSRPEASEAPEPPEKPENSCNWERMKKRCIPISGEALLALWRRWAGDQEPPPRLSLLEGVDRLPMDGISMNREYVRAALDLERHARKRLKILEAAEKKGEKVAPYCQVYLSQDKMVAWAFVFPPSDREEPVSVEQLGLAMKKYKVESGIDPAMVARLFRPEYWFRMLPIAVGRAAVQPVPGFVTDWFRRRSAAEVKVDENGNMDYRTRKQFQMVKKGQEICAVDPGKEGKSGFRVDGSIIEPQKLPPLGLPQGRNIILSRDGRSLLAAFDGTLDFKDGKFHVQPVLEIKGDVSGATTGDVDFYGDVHISGDVTEKMVVRAAGDIIIDGLVEAAEVEAGGSIMIAKGVLGNYRAVVKSSGGSVQAKYLENCVVYAHKNVAAECILVSQVFANGVIQVTGGRGTVIGGELAAGVMVKARIIGSQAGRQTLITLGGRPVWGEEVRRNEEELTAIRREIYRADDELERLLAESMDEEELKKAYQNRSRLSLREMQLRQQREKLSKGEKADVRKCRMEASLVYPPTTVTAGIRPFHIEELAHFCHIRFDPELGDIRRY